MSGPQDWSKTADNLAIMMQSGMGTEEARDVFESIHGFRPNTGRPTPVLKRLWRRWFS